jgi:hypothetical protein
MRVKLTWMSSLPFFFTLSFLRSMAAKSTEARVPGDRGSRGGRREGVAGCCVVGSGVCLYVISGIYQKGNAKRPAAVLANAGA